MITSELTVLTCDDSGYDSNKASNHTAVDWSYLPTHKPLVIGGVKERRGCGRDVAVRDRGMGGERGGRG